MIKLSEFCEENKIPCYLAQCNGDKIKFYIQSLYLNDITKSSDRRLTPTEQNVLAHIIDFVINNGQVKNDKNKFNLLVNYLVSKKVIKNKANFSTNKTNILGKGYLKEGQGRNSVVVEEKLLQVIQIGQINIFISLK